MGLLGRTGKYTTCAPELTGGMLSVSMARCDVSITEEAQWWSTQSALGVDGHRMGSLVHAAGVLLDTVIGNQSAFLMRSSMSPKLTASCRMQQGCWLEPMGSMVYFSSISALHGSPGQVNYGCANSCLD